MSQKIDNHGAGFRPSRFGALEECIHYASKPGGEAAQNGIQTHEQIAAALVNLPFAPEPHHPAVRFALSLVTGYAQDGWSIFAVEYPVHLIDTDGTSVTQGTIDLVLVRDRDYLIIDWKTGEPRNYSAQLAGYTMALYDRLPEAKSVHAIAVFLDANETHDHTQSYQKATDRFLDLYEKWKGKDNANYTINQYCGWCALRPDCPAWRSQADVALQVAQGLESSPGPVSQAKIDHLKNSPGDLERFVLAFERFKTLVDEDWALKAALKSHIETGYKAEFYSLVNVKDKETVAEVIDPEQYLQKVVKELGTMKAAAAVTIDPTIAKETWAAFSTDRPFPVPIKTALSMKSGYSYLKQKNKK
jgi:hypothetical protein